MLRRRCTRFAVLATALLLTVACKEGAPAASGSQTASQRTGRFGALRDLVLVDSSEGLFVDRFESTQKDWAEFAATPAGAAAGAGEVALVGRMSLPVGGMSLQQARAFARWRCCRLPSEREWLRVTRGGGNAPFPWGSKEDATRANTGDLALGERMPVGTFESGRRAGGDAPYDLIGNVREWTESVPLEWCQDDSPDPSSFWRSVRRVRRQPCLGQWADRFGIVPGGVVAVLGGEGVPRRCVGADFETQMRFVRQRRHDTQAAGERRMRTGVRVYTTAGELLARVAAIPGSVSAVEQLQLAAFVARQEHRAVLREAYERAPISATTLAPDSAGAALVAEVLRGP